MKNHTYRAICHTKCYWLENLWQPGEVYEGDIKPIKHFSEDGKIDTPLPPKNPADDPRSNDELRKILKNKYQTTKPKSWTRKQLWSALYELENAESRDEFTNPDSGNDFIAACGFVSKSKAGLSAHERTCPQCNKEPDLAA